MPAPAFASGTTLAKAFVVSTTTITKPSGVSAGDLLVLAVNTESNTPTISCSGFTDWRLQGTSDELTVMTRIADGSEGANFTISTTSGVQLSAACARYTGTHASSPLDSVSGMDSGGNYWLERSFAAITTAQADELLLGIIGIRQAPDTTAVSGWTLDINNSPNLLMYSKVRATAGTEAQTNFDQTTVYDLWDSVTGAIKPAAAASMTVPRPRGALATMGLR